MARFELATTYTPSRCATRLRYIPTARSNGSFTIAVEESQYFAQLLAHLAQCAAAGTFIRRHLRGGGFDGAGRDRRVDASRELGLEPLLRSRDREPFVVEQL